MTRCLCLSVLVGLALTTVSCVSETLVTPVQNPPTFTVSLAAPTTSLAVVPADTPTVGLSPMMGGPKTQIAVTGRGFPPQAPVSLRIVPVPEDGNSLAFGGVVADSQGRFSFSLTMPDRWSNDAPITQKELMFLAADAASSIKATARFDFLIAALTTPASATQRPATVRPFITPLPSPTPSPAQTLAASVSTTFVNVRAGPDLSTNLITRLDQGQTMSLLGRTADDVWVQVRLPGGQQGWVPAVSITANVSINRLPVTTLPSATPTPERAFTTSGYVIVRGTSLRSGPGSNFGLIKRLGQGQDMSLVGRDAAGIWVQVYLSDALQGWVMGEHVDTDGPIGVLPVTAGTPIPSGVTRVPGPVAFPSGGPLQLRSGPGTNYQVVIVSALGRDQAMSMLGRNGAATWVQVRLLDGNVGWVTADSIRASLPVTDVSVIADPQPSVNLIPAAAGPGATVQVNAEGFLSNREVAVTLALAGTDHSLVVARGTTNARGAIQLLFTMPGLWPDGAVIAQDDLNLAVSSLDGTASASVYLRFLR